MCKGFKGSVCFNQRTKSACACNVQVIKVAEAVLVLYTEETLIWQRKKYKGSGGNKGTLIHTSCLTTLMKTGPEEEIWARKLHKILLTDVCQNKIMGTEASSDYTYSSITPSYLKRYHRCDQAKIVDIRKEAKKSFVNLKAMELIVLKIIE